MKVIKRTLVILLLLLSNLLFAQEQDIRAELRSHVDFFTSDSLLGRKAGSQGEKTAAEYLYDQLSELGLVMLTPRSGQDFSIVEDRDTIKSMNIIGIIEGYDKTLKHEYILIGASIDHFGMNYLITDGQKVQQIYPGADESASGIACLIEIATKIKSSSFMFRRSVIFAGFGAEELGMAGSWYFVNRAFKEVDNISLMIDLDMVGRTGPTNQFTYSTGIPNPELTTSIAKIAGEIAFPPPVLGLGDMQSSDYLAFYEKKIPVTLFTTGTHRDIRSIRDRAELLDYNSMERICNFIYLYALEIANADKQITIGVSTEIGKTIEENVYSKFDVDKTPTFFHGNEQVFLDRWVYDYLKYPDVPLAQGIQGTVVVEFIIETDGSVSSVEVERGVDEYLDEEAVRVISASPKWKAGQLGGKKVRVKYSIPVEFRLKKR